MTISRPLAAEAMREIGPRIAFQSANVRNNRQVATSTPHAPPIQILIRFHGAAAVLRHADRAPSPARAVCLAVQVRNAPQRSRKEGGGVFMEH
jgi:hypothetical protein